MARKSKKTPEPTLPDAPLEHCLEVATLSRAIETRFDLQPDADTRTRISGFMGLERLETLRFKGELHPRKKDAWQLKARLTATLAQACIVTLTPIAEKVDEDITVDLLPEHRAKDASEAELELSAEDDPDYFQDEIDIAAIALEQLALALDPYPRVPDAKLQTDRFAAPGIEPLTDSDLKPFAKLADLKKKLENKGP